MLPTEDGRLRVRFQIEHRVRELARFNLGIDSQPDDVIFPSRLHHSPHLGIEVDDPLEIPEQAEV